MIVKQNIQNNYVNILNTYYWLIKKTKNIIFYKSKLNKNNYF